MGEKRRGRQTPAESVVLPYKASKGPEAVELYNSSGRQALEWQELLVKNIMAANDDELWTHQKFGFSVPRRNGKNEIAAMREFWGLVSGEQICHTTHRTTTSGSVWRRLCRILSDGGYEEVARIPKDRSKPPDKWFHPTKQYGLESVEMPDGGRCAFRTRTPNGGLGEGFDLLVMNNLTVKKSGRTWNQPDQGEPEAECETCLSMILYRNRIQSGNLFSVQYPNDILIFR